MPKNVLTVTQLGIVLAEMARDLNDRAVARSKYPEAPSDVTAIWYGLAMAFNAGAETCLRLAKENDNG